MYYTIYKITNKINKKIYVGAHKTNNLDDSYMGSGQLIKDAKKKYGIQNLTKEYLAIFDNPSEMFEMESTIVNEDFVNREDTYNLKVGGISNISNEIYDEIIEGNKKGRQKANNIMKEKMGDDFLSIIGKKGSKKAKISILKKRKEDPEFDKRIRENCGKSFKGKHHTEESKQKIGKANSFHQKGSRNSQYGMMWITDGSNNKKIKKDNDIPEGWRKGRVMK
jgi:hypothetical protein